ncbi:outer-membrane lipoprotein carrier protein LolA [bacterium]|nr:outer-membrane lipoprotein carrier protein LolA [bacterium]
MRKTKKISGIIISFLVILIAISIAEASPPKGKKLIKEIQEVYASLENLTSTFRMEFQWELAGEMEVTEGKMIWGMGDRFRYETEREMMVSDGKTLWRYSLITNQVIVEDLKKADLGFLPREILFEFPKLFSPREVMESKIGDTSAWLLLLEPKEEDLGIKELKVWVSQTEKITQRMEWIDLDGNRTTYSLDEIELNKELKADAFTVKVPDDATVYDLR